MSNAYYTPSTLSEHTLAKASDINSATSSIEAAFDLLPLEAAIKEDRVTYQATDTGSADVYAIALPNTITSYVAGLRISWIPANSNTGASTLNVDGIGAKSIKVYDGTDPAALTLVAGRLTDVQYDGTNFVIMSATAASEAASAASAAASAASATAAETAETNAETAETNAAASAAAASTSETNASGSETAAAASAISAASAAAGGLYKEIQDKTANYTVVLADQGDLIKVDATSGNLVILLDDLDTIGEDIRFAISKSDASANTVTISRTDTDTINGVATSIVLTDQYDQYKFIGDASANDYIALNETAGAITGGNGIDKTGGVLSVDLTTNAGLEISGATLGIKLDGASLALGSGGISLADAELTSIAGLTSAADKLPYYTGLGTASLADFTAYDRSNILNNASEAAFKASVNLEIGTDVQAYDADTAKLDVDQAWTGAQRATVTALTSTSNATAIDFGDSNDFSIAMTENTTLSEATGTEVAGQHGSIFITNHASTGPYTLAFHSSYLWVGGTDGVLTPSLSAKDTIDYRIRADGVIELSISLGLA